MTNKKQLTFIDLFAGYGGGRQGLEQAGMKCIGFCEHDKYAVASYVSMHLITEEQRDFLNTLTKKQRQKEILKEEYKNGEWYWNDVTTLKGSEVPKADIWIFGAPCQSFSIAGQREGLKGQSGLIFEILRVLEETEENRPDWIIYENVKGMFSSNRGFDYLAILLKMESLGYDIQWQLFNSADYVPQNRERVYTIGHLRKSGGYSSKVLSFEGSNRKDSVYGINILGHRQNYRRNLQVFSPNGITEVLSTAGGGGRGHHTIEVIGKMDLGHECNGRIYDENGISPCLNGIGNGGNHESKVGIEVIGHTRLYKGNPKNDKERILSVEGIGTTLRSSDYKEPLKVAIDIETVPLEIGGHSVSESTGNAHSLNVNDQRKIFGANQKRTIAGHNIIGITNDQEHKKKECNQGIFVRISSELVIYAIYCPFKDCYIAIRKLTPKECFRLQGMSDKYFERAQFVNSDSQLYKQAGNAMTVNVVQSVGDAIIKFEETK